MDFTYHFLKTYLKETRPEEIHSKGLSPQNPSLVFLYEVIIAYLQELSSYLLKLKAFGLTNKKIKNDILEASLSIL